MIHWFQLVKAFQLGPLTAGLPESWVLGVPETHLPPSPSSFFQGLQKRALQYILRLWHLRVWGPDPPSSSMETMLALEPWGDRPGGETWLDCRRSGGSLEKVRGWSGIEMGGEPRTHPLAPASQGPHPPGDLPDGHPVGSQVAGQAVPSSLAGADPADSGRSEVVLADPPEAVGTPPQEGRALLSTVQ